MKKTIWAPLLFGVLVLTGCGKKPMPPPPQTPEVGVVTVTSKPMPVTVDLPGRIDAVRVAQVRARVTGIVLKRIYVEGSDVREGDVLFQIDPAPLQAALDSAKAGLAHAKAELAQTQSQAERYKALVAIHAVSKQDYDNAVAAALQAKADVANGRANVEAASLNLGYARVTAPITGHIGPALVTEGALVSETDLTPMALIQQLDPIYFDFTQSSTDVLKLRDAFEKGRLQKVATDGAKVVLNLEDGSVYKYSGKLLFRDMSVDPSTSMVTLRAEFPNPDHLLLPGMFVRGQFVQAVDQNAITVLQRAVALKGDGTGTVMVVGPDNKVEARTVKLGDAIEDKWIVTGGLKAGETVIAEGLQKARPHSTVKPVPFEGQ